MSDYNEEAQNPDASASAASPPAEGGQKPAGNMSTDTRYIRSLEGIVKLVSVVSYTYGTTFRQSYVYMASMVVCKYHYSCW